ncbi:hypothetical protein HETIRDRAFT_328972, partial [Heterobasidion irregulare TC 32-1]
CLIQSQNYLGTIISHSLLLFNMLLISKVITNNSLSLPTLKIVLVLCSVLRDTSSISMH